MTSRRNSTTHSIGSGSGASFRSDEDGSEMGQLSVSVSELNQLRQHVRDMRKTMTSKSRSTDDRSVLEEVDLANSGVAGSAIMAEDALTPEQRKRLFRLSILGNIIFVLGAILYICVAHGDLDWAQEVQGIPLSVLQADDDATWVNWQKAHPEHRRTQEKPRTLQLREIADDDTGTDYNRLEWHSLPADIQLALMVLGHNQHTWNNAMTSSIEELPWDQLTAEQKDAAKIIGYTAEEWDAAEAEEQKMWEASQAAYGDVATDGDDQTDDKEDGDDQANDDKDGDDDQILDEDDEEEEDEDDDKTNTGGGVVDWYKESAAGDDKYPEEVGTGGVTQSPSTASPTTAPPTTSPTVSPTVSPPITEAPVNAAEAYVEADTRKPPVTPAPGVPTNVKSPADLMIWGDYDWEGLPDQVKKAFEILGYNEELWNTGGVAFTEDLYWSDLTPDQQEQAMVLGYTQALWDQAEDENYDIVTGETDDDATDDKASESKEDDAVDKFGAPVGDSDIKTESMMLFFASLCFMLTGLISWFRDRQVFHIWMIQGGVFGTISALTMSFSDFASLMLQTVSVHCYLLQSFFMLSLRKTIRPVEGLERIHKALWGADIAFVLGALIQVIMVYCLHTNDNAYNSVGLARGEVFAAWCWLFTAAIYTWSTIAQASKRIEEDNMTRTLTITRQHPNGETYTIRPAAIQLRNQPPVHDVVLT